MNGSGGTIRLPPGCRAKAVAAASISASSRTGVAVTSAASDDAAAPGLIGCRLRIEYECRPPHVRGDLLEHLQPFPDQGEVDEGEAGDVAARTRHAADEALSDWIVDHTEDNRDGAGRLFQGGKDRRAGGDNEVRCGVNQFCRVSLHSGKIASGKAMLDLNVAVLRPSERLECLPKCSDAPLYFRIVLGK